MFLYRVLCRCSKAEQCSDGRNRIILSGTLPTKSGPALHFLSLNPDQMFRLADNCHFCFWSRHSHELHAALGTPTSSVLLTTIER